MLRDPLLVQSHLDVSVRSSNTHLICNRSRTNLLWKPAGSLRRCGPRSHVMTVDRLEANLHGNMTYYSLTKMQLVLAEEAPIWWPVSLSFRRMISLHMIDFNSVQGRRLWLWVTDQHNGRPACRQCRVLLFLLCLKSFLDETSENCGVTTSCQGDSRPFCPDDVRLLTHNTFYCLSSSSFPFLPEATCPSGAC